MNSESPPDPSRWRLGQKPRGKPGHSPTSVQCGELRWAPWGPAASKGSDHELLEMAMEYVRLLKVVPRMLLIMRPKSKRNFSDRVCPGASGERHRAPGQTRFGALAGYQCNFFRRFLTLQ